MKLDFTKYQFRASQMHFLMTGNIGLSDLQENKLQSNLDRKASAELGTAKPLTPTMIEEVKELSAKKASNELPKTMQKELRKIHRSERYNRNFIFTNKFVQKGIAQEEEAITLYQEYRKKVLGINTYFTKNEERLKNEWFSGEPDLRPVIMNGKKVGFDIKCSWSLESFPYAEDDLDSNYEYQNQVYMDLEDADQWITVYCLVNGTEQHLFNEKQKYFYALGMPDLGEKNYDEYIERCKDVEKMMIYDYDRFVNQHHALLEISREEWFDNGYDIPLEERIIEKVSYRNEDTLAEMKKRIVIAREYLAKLELNFKL